MTFEVAPEGAHLPGDPSWYASRDAADLVPSAPVVTKARTRVRPLPTAPARVVAAGGLAALVVLVGLATLDALRATDWEQPRPRIDGAMVAAAVAMLCGWTCWAVLAAVNARRAGLRDVPNPLIVVAVGVLQVASWFAVDEFATDHNRRLWWAAWVGAAVLMHWLATLAYRTSSAVLGEAYGHFTLVAWLPLLAGGVAVAAVFHAGAVFGLPMVAAMAVWLVVEAFQAMATWDLECRVRITGVDPSAPKPVVEQYAEAVAKASPVMQVPAGTRFHHTLLPRAMVMASLVVGLSLPAWVIVLEQNGHVSVTGIHTTIDDEGTRWMTALVVAAMVGYALGWLWWSVAAALNATNRSRWSVAAWAAPVGYAISLAVVGAVPVISDHVDPELGTLVVLLGVFVLAIAHFAVLRAYRQTAAAIGGAVTPWTLVIMLPWAALAFSVIVAFLSKAIGDAVFERVMQGGWVAFYAGYAISLYSAMASFDRACSGTVLGRAGRGELPEFLKQRGRSADTRA